MFETRANFTSVNGKRRILIVDDEAINREMLEFFLQDEYEILMASDGKKAMRLIWEFRETLSVVNRAYLVYEGRLLREGSSKELVEDPDVREKYLGENFRM